MSWESVLKNEDEKTTQSKLPKELIPDGATVATRPIEEWFKGKPKKTKPVDNTKGTSQTSLGDFEKAEKPPAKYWDKQINILMLSDNKAGIEQLIQGVKDNSTDNKGYTYDRVQILRAANRQMKEAGNENEKELIQMILDGIPKALRDTQSIDERPLMKNKIQLILDGKHDEALEYFNANERRRRELKVWDEKNENKLSEYLKDKPELAAQLKFKLPQKEEDLKVKVDESKLTPTFLVEYLQMLYNVGKLIDKRYDYVPRQYVEILGGKSAKVNPSLEWIMQNPNFNPSKFPKIGTIKQSTQQEAIISMLRNNIFIDEDSEFIEDVGKNVSEIIQELWDDSNNSFTTFKRLMSEHPNNIALEKEFKSRISGAEKVDYSIPKEDYDALVSVKDGDLNEQELKLLEKYFTDIDTFEVLGYYEQYKSEINRMKDNRSGGMRAASIEDGKKLMRLFGQQGGSKTISLDTVDTDEDALDSYLASAVPPESQTTLKMPPNPLTGDVASQSVTLKNVIKLLNKISTTPNERGGGTLGGIESISRIMRAYRKNPSEENEKKFREALSQSNYDKIRNHFLDTLKKKIVDYMGSGEKSVLHGMKKKEPYYWVKARVANDN